MQPKYQLLSVEQLGGHTSANSKRFDLARKKIKLNYLLAVCILPFSVKKQQKQQI